MKTGIDRLWKRIILLLLVCLLPGGSIAMEAAAGPLRASEGAFASRAAVQEGYGRAGAAPEASGLIVHAGGSAPEESEDSGILLARKKKKKKKKSGGSGQNAAQDSQNAGSGQNAAQDSQNAGSGQNAAQDSQGTGSGQNGAQGSQDAEPAVGEEGTYTSKEEVALYIHLYGHLPDNFITKKEAQKLGWENRRGNLDEVAPGKSIGGDYFGNYEGQLPEKKGRTYRECDIDYEGGYRDVKRIVYSDDGLIYYTEDHYHSFEQLY